MSDGFIRPRSTGTTFDEWRTQALCIIEHADPALFFPPMFPAFVNRQMTAEALSYCRRCPVVDPCLEAALEDRIQDGIWGGMIADHRKTLKRQRRKAAR